jgi:hypothetical protein
LTATLAVAWAASDPGREPAGEVTITEYPREYKEFQRWFQSPAFGLPGEASFSQVVAILGKRYKNLDRPARDGIRTIEYDLADLGIRSRKWGKDEWVILDFDVRTNRLLKKGTRELTFAICGFCPHVFVADTVGWRLEGKMLPGCVGAAAEGTDTLLLPRATVLDGSVRVRLANLAPEIEYLDEALLGAVPLEEGQELDLTDEGKPFAWSLRRELPTYGNAPDFPLVGDGADRVLVLEVRNTSTFETAMREWFLAGGQRVEATLTVRFDVGPAATVRPVGTKFLRRVVVPVPAGARRVSLDVPGSYWLVRRAWTGTGRCTEDDTVWCPATPDTAGLLAARDGQRLRLGPDEAVDLTFPAPQDGRRRGYVLRLVGYYEFLRR